MALPVQSPGFSDALVILGCAGIVIPAFARLRVNAVIGFIIVGALIGPAGLGALAPAHRWLFYLTISDPEGIEPFAELGIVLLLFSIGLELSLPRLWGMRRQLFLLGPSQLIGAALLTGFAIRLTGQPWVAAFGLGIALALSSTALVLPIAGTTSAVGRGAFAMLLFEDLALIPIIFTLGSFAPHAHDVGWQALVASIAYGTGVIVALLAVGYFLLPRLFAQAARTHSPELFMAASLLVVILASIATTAAGLSPIVGALLAGLLIAETDYAHEVEVMTAPFKGLALGIFLITVGMSLDLHAIVRDWPKLVLAVLAVVLIKALVTGLLLRFAGARRGVAAETALLMAAPSETTLIVLSAAAAAQLIAPATAAFWQTVTAIGLTITPLLARLGRDFARRVERRSAQAPPHDDGGAPRAIIVGFGRVGRLVAEMLRVHDRPFIAIDADVDAVAAARAEGLPALYGNAGRPELLERLGLARATALILTMDDPVQQLRLTRAARRAHPALTIVARARDAAHAAELYKAGATDAVPEQLESSLQLSEAVLVDLGIAMGPVIASIHDKRAEQRAAIMAMGEMAKPPKERGQRLRDRAPG
ncbi:MAG: cation:proton antiporter [Sphingomonadaceae bacterium]|nr:cation:proton antiporter [Sphingomonadaceae bacterium]